MKRLVLGLGLSVLAALPIILLPGVGQAATVPSSGGLTDFKNEGSSLGAITTLDVVGAGCEATRTGTAGTITCGSSYFDPREYGAVCDGATDDATSLQATFDDLPSTGGAVQFPAGNCLSSTTIYSGLSPPVHAAFSTAASGGSLSAGTYWYRITATNATGESFASYQTSIVVVGTGNDDTATVNWNKVAGATGYKVYCRTTGAQGLCATVGDVATWIDTGSVSPGAGVPTADTSGSSTVLVYGQGEGVSSLTFTANTHGLALAFGAFTQYGAVRNLGIYTTVANSNTGVRLSWPDTNTNSGHIKMCSLSFVEVAGAHSASSLAIPVNAAFSTATTGGTLAAATYWYRIVATNALGGTIPSTQTSQVTTGSTSTVTVNWTQVTGATGYKVYGRTTGCSANCLMATWNGSSWDVGSGDADTWTDTGAVTPAGAMPVVDTAAPSWMTGISLNDAWECQVHDISIRGRYNMASTGPGVNNWVTGSIGLDLNGNTIDVLMHTIHLNSLELGINCCGVGAGDGVPGAEGLQITNLVFNRGRTCVKVFDDDAIAAADMPSPWLAIYSSHCNTMSAAINTKNRYEVLISGMLIYEGTATVGTLENWNGISFNGCIRCNVVDTVIYAGGDGSTLVERGMNIAAGTAGSGTAASYDISVSNVSFVDADGATDPTPLLQVDDAAATTIQLVGNQISTTTSFVTGTITGVTMLSNLPAQTLANLPAVKDGSTLLCANCGRSSSDGTCSTTSGVLMTVQRDGGVFSC